MANECIPFKQPGTEVTGQASAAVTGKRFLAITGNMQTDGSITVAHATAAGRICGVAKYDAASGAKVGVIRGSKAVVPVTAGGTIAAGAEVEVGTNGQAVTKSAGVAVGYVETGATNGNDARVVLY
ncbi:MAG: DUF2190 domain-containing protein [Myxococcaceae bacterium]|nr:MAG: DUF2190 domain-containing protein [Myxococcaceae bacterium]